MMYRYAIKLRVVGIACLLTQMLSAQATEIIYLSGKGPDDAVKWEFYCTEGRNSGKWTTIPVPSNWEFHGFGRYNYGHDKDKGKEEGWYRHQFTIPLSVKGKRVIIVFDGSMTDTYVSVNGKSAGPVHQGAFYRFQYDITSLVKPGKENLLEVKVHKHSSNASVNKAEREGDYWIFGGIFRPVYLTVVPQRHIQRTAIDANSGGDFKMHVFTTPAGKRMIVRAQVLSLNGQPVGDVFSTELEPGDTLVEVQGMVHKPLLWNAEQPNLYRMRVDLLDQSGTLIHTHTERFGFRTVEVRAGDGIYINGTKVILKGVNRHCTWPTTGKAISQQQSLHDALLIKEMNMNAVRMSHYPPDRHFLEICDSLGLYVLNELAGWQKAYDTAVGAKLVK
ncbi:MAG TPA: glycoside hydrolase family 2 TIM barrel-domain containing protein [Phnomibacter sp.]|nr:glycoside hydrolase family 2 TIM barrel-domain containing protein [Phnomibacter sp.]